MLPVSCGDLCCTDLWHMVQFFGFRGLAPKVAAYLRSCKVPLGRALSGGTGAYPSCDLANSVYGHWGLNAQMRCYSDGQLC